MSNYYLNQFNTDIQTFFIFDIYLMNMYNLIKVVSTTKQNKIK